MEADIEWPTLAFFALLFIAVGAAVATGLVGTLSQGLASFIDWGTANLGLSPSGTLLFAALLILWASGVLSALIDNIPYVAVTIPIIASLTDRLPGDTTILWWALALGACLGGNGTVIGASANVTVVGLAERAGTYITFGEFARLGARVAGVALADFFSVYRGPYLVRANDYPGGHDCRPGSLLRRPGVTSPVAATSSRRVDCRSVKHGFFLDADPLHLALAVNHYRNHAARTAANGAGHELLKAQPGGNGKFVRDLLHGFQHRCGSARVDDHPGAQSDRLGGDPSACNPGDQARLAAFKAGIAGELRRHFPVIE